ncbi:MAG: outer membrane protein assembly factor BamD [Bdellovibrionales bacterium]|nr:outer membrane protein assembly factor BamD [Bdellovibrionales bacterium]
MRNLLFLTIGILVGCSSTSKFDSNTVEGAFAIAESYEKDERYEEAIAQFQQVKNKYPYSNLAVESELHIAGIYFKREDFVEAQGAYQTFKELHPSHAKSDFVTYRLGLSLFNQLPSTIDRDLSVAEKALLYFDEVVTSFSKSEYLSPSTEHKQKILQMLAQKEFYIAQFYFIREYYESALARYEDLFTKYPNSQQEPEALYGACISANQLKDSGKTQHFLEKLVYQYPNSTFALKVKKEIGHAN